MAKSYDDKGLLSNLRHWRDCAMLTSEQTSVLHVSHLSAIIAALETVQPVVPDEITSITEANNHTGGNAYELEYYRKGWNAYRAAMLSGSTPNGMKPEPILDPTPKNDELSSAPEPITGIDLSSAIKKAIREEVLDVLNEERRAGGALSKW